MGIIDNKKGQQAIAAFMVCLVIFIAAVAMIPGIKSVVTIARDTSHLDCGNTSITVGEQATCIATDIYLPYFFIMALAGGIAYITGRKVVQGV